MKVALRLALVAAFASIAFAAWQWQRAVQAKRALDSRSTELASCRKEAGDLRSKEAANLQLLLAQSRMIGDDGVAEGKDATRPNPQSLAVTIGTPEVRGRLASSAVDEVAHAREHEVRDCYADALARNPKIRGRMWVKFIVTQDGWVQAGAVDNSHLEDPRLEQCVAHAVRSWSFPSPKGGIAVVTLPFDLQLGTP